MQPNLDRAPARTLTDRECAAILGSLIGGLAAQNGIAVVRSAVEFWNEEETWRTLTRQLEDQCER